MKTHGKVTVGFGTIQEQELDIVDFVQAEFADHRLVSVTELEDDTLTMSVENPASTGRATSQSIRLGRESFVALIMTAHLFFQLKGLDMAKVLEEVAINEEINYSYSAGITSPD